MKHTYLWNELPYEERLRLTPYMIESQIRDIQQCKRKAKKAHESLMKDMNNHIKNLRSELSKLEKIL